MTQNVVSYSSCVLPTNRMVSILRLNKTVVLKMPVSL